MWFPSYPHPHPHPGADPYSNAVEEALHSEAQEEEALMEGAAMGISMAQAHEQQWKAYADGYHAYEQQMRLTEGTHDSNEAAEAAPLDDMTELWNEPLYATCRVEIVQTMQHQCKSGATEGKGMRKMTAR